MMLDPMGKAYYWKLHELTDETKYSFGYGFYAKRRREQAILVHHAVAGRLKTAAAKAGPKEKNTTVTLDLCATYPMPFPLCRKRN